MEQVLLTLWWRGFEPEEKLRQQQTFFSNETDARGYLEDCSRNPDIYIHHYTIYRLVPL